MAFGKEGVGLDSGFREATRMGKRDVFADENSVGNNYVHLLGRAGGGEVEGSRKLERREYDWLPGPRTRNEEKVERILDG